MKTERMLELKDLYENTLLGDILPFWMKHSIDKVNGGYYNYLDRDGSILSRDKSVWIQGRMCWLFSLLYNKYDKRPEWLEMAKTGYEFLQKFCFDEDGRMFFIVTDDGKPLRKRRYWFSETFAIIAFAEYASASGDEAALEMARKVYRMIVGFYKNPGGLEPKTIPATRSLRGHSYPMILIATSQVMRAHDGDPLYDEVIDLCIHDLFAYFVKPERQVLLETVGPKGEIIDNPEGRCINPGHAIETSWFLMHEGLHRNDRELIKKALDILDWSYARGWDPEFGGLFSFVDLEGKPPEKLEWDMKFWWPHSELLYAALLAYDLTGADKYEAMYETVHQWTFGHFPDPVHGEWYGYLHRDGSVSVPIKGSTWKSPFHISRQLLYGTWLLDKMIKAEKVHSKI
jgi:N-acylglucosamine 2-epimerase